MTFELSSILTTSKMQESAAAGRGQDLTRMNRYIIGTLPPVPEFRGFDDTDPTKNSRGFNHVWTARALCGVELLPTFDLDAEKYVTFL